MTSSEELADLRQRLAAYADHLRSEARSPWPGLEERYMLRIADEIERLFLTDTVTLAEPVFAYGEREEEMERIKTELFGPVCHDGYRRLPREQKQHGKA